MKKIGSLGLFCSCLIGLSAINFSTPADAQQRRSQSEQVCDNWDCPGWGRGYHYSGHRWGRGYGYHYGGPRRGRGYGYHSGGPRWDRGYGYHYGGSRRGYGYHHGGSEWGRGYNDRYDRPRWRDDSVGERGNRR